MLTYEEITKSEAIKTYIIRADESLGALGFTEHSFAHVMHVHHIIPRSEGGSNKKENLVELPPRAHHLAHLCLIKLGYCLKYCYYNFTIKEYYEAKMLEKKKKHLLLPEDVDTVDEINEYRYEGEQE